MSLSEEVKTQIRERFTPHADFYTLVGKSVDNEKQGQHIYDVPSDDIWAKHFDGVARIALCPMAAQGLIEWAVLDIDDRDYSELPTMAYQGHYPSSSGRCHVYFRFDKGVPVDEARTLLTNIATNLGVDKSDVFPSSQGNTTVSLPCFGNDTAARLFLTSTERGRSIAEYYDLFSIHPNIPLCIAITAKADLTGISDTTMYKGMGSVIKHLSHGDVAPFLEGLGDNGRRFESKIISGGGTALDIGCETLESQGLCGGATCPHHRKHRRVTTSTAPSDGVEVFLTAEHIEEAYAICNLEDGSLSTFYVKFTFCPEHYIPFKAGNLTDRLALKRNIAGIAMRTINIEKDAVASLASRVMALSNNNPKTQHIGHTTAVMSGIAVILDELPHTPPEKIEADQGMWASNMPDGRTAVPKAALVEQLTRHVKEATRTNIHATLQRLCETGHLNETTLDGQIVFTLDAPTRLKFQTQKGG